MREHATTRRQVFKIVAPGRCCLRPSCPSLLFPRALSLFSASSCAPRRRPSLRSLLPVFYAQRPVPSSLDRNYRESNEEINSSYQRCAAQHLARSLFQNTLSICAVLQLLLYLHSSIFFTNVCFFLFYLFSLHQFSLHVPVHRLITFNLYLPLFGKINNFFLCNKMQLLHYVLIIMFFIV